MFSDQGRLCSATACTSGTYYSLSDAEIEYILRANLFVFAVCASPLGIYAWKGLEQTSGRNFAYSVFAAVKCEFPTLGEVSAQSLVSAPSSSACAISAVVAANSPSATPDTAG